MPKGYRARVHFAAVDRQAGQGLSLLPLNQEHAMVNKEWTKRGMPVYLCPLTVCLTSPTAQRDGIVQKKILSDKAKGIINTELQQKAYENRKGAVEPPYMAPSADPVDYSNVRTHMLPYTYLLRSLVVLPVPRLRSNYDPVHWVSCWHLLHKR
jgi:hypothetical protein